MRRRAAWVPGWLVALALSGAASAGELQRRVDRDVAAGRPIVVHVTVALCDNANQGIVPVPEQLGDGRAPRTNLYWGALYGVRTHLGRAGWQRIPVARPDDPRILERVAFRGTEPRGDGAAEVVLVADAWDGARIREAMAAHLAMAGGEVAEQIALGDADGRRTVGAGGAAHVVVYVGHNGWMEFDAPAPARAADAPPRGAMVLACASKPYFESPLRAAGAEALLLTTGLMAPEAYTLDAAVRAWVRGDPVREAAATAYDRFQHCGLSAARRLFWSANATD